MKRIYVSHGHRRGIRVAVLAAAAGLAAWALSARSAAQSSAGEANTPIVIDRAPAWVISREPYDPYSGTVAVDPVRNEIILQSPEMLFVYDRQANTPPRVKSWSRRRAGS